MRSWESVSGKQKKKQSNVKAEESIFERTMKNVAAISAVLAGILFIVYRSSRWKIFFSFAVTAGTVCYHFTIRLFCGWVVNYAAAGCLQQDAAWFRQKKWEAGLYRKLRVKQWKKKLPTYVSDNFSMEKHTLDEIVRNMCVAELVHEINIVLSYGSLAFTFLASDWREDIWIYLITATLAACFDVVFVIIQRFNRPRLVLLQEKMHRMKKKEYLKPGKDRGFGSKEA